MLQRIGPAVGERGYTVWFSVATRISPAKARDCPYTAPSNPARHPKLNGIGEGVLSERSVRTGFWWSTGQLAVTSWLASEEGGADGALARGAEGLSL